MATTTLSTICELIKSWDDRESTFYSLDVYMFNAFVNKIEPKLHIFSLTAFEQ